MTKAPPSRPPKHRRLSDDEIALWLTVAASVEPRPGSRLPARVALPPAPVPEPVPEAAPGPLAPVPPSVPKPPPLAPLERRLKQRLSRGTVTADAAIDLHGMRQGEAHQALRHFLHRSLQKGARVVIVVTGKGGRARTTPEDGFGETGVLRRAVPLWLAMPDFRPMVVGFEEAAQHHGGAGALYVRLRRRDRLDGV